MVVEQLLDSGVAVYPVKPMSARRHRERRLTSGTKIDRHDACVLADALRTDGHACRTVGPKDSIIEALRILCLVEVTCIEECTAPIKELRQPLREYYPTEVEVLDDWTSPCARAFVKRFPTAEALFKAGKMVVADVSAHAHAGESANV